MVGGEGEATVIEQWSRVRGRLRTEVGEAAYRSWLKPLTLAGSRNGRLRLAVPTRFMRDWVASNYGSRLFALWSEEDPDIGGIEIVVQPPARPTPKPGAGAPMLGVAEAAATEIVGHETVQRESRAAAQLNGMAAARAEAAASAAASAAATGSQSASGIWASLDPRFTFDNFVVGKPNELAYAAARRVAEAPTPPFNPLFLYGGVGLGKTHLMHAIGLQIKKQAPERRIIYLSA
jgi:chromosomal replication initiator protein